LKEIQGKIDKGTQPLNCLLAKSGLRRLRRTAWLYPSISASSPKEQELLKSLPDDLKENDEMLKHDSKSQDDLFKGLHYERNQVKSQVYIGQAYEFLL
jgi:hypothetical protein